MAGVGDYCHCRGCRDGRHRNLCTPGARVQTSPPRESPAAAQMKQLACDCPRSSACTHTHTHTFTADPWHCMSFASLFISIKAQACTPNEEKKKKKQNSHQTANRVQRQETPKMRGKEKKNKLKNSNCVWCICVCVCVCLCVCLCVYQPYRIISLQRARRRMFPRHRAAASCTFCSRAPAKSASTHRDGMG